MEIPSTNLQIANNIQIRITNDPNMFGIWDLNYCGSWNLRFL
jgi:hypothetical protein